MKQKKKHLKYNFFHKIFKMKKKNLKTSSQLTLSNSFTLFIIISINN